MGAISRSVNFEFCATEAELRKRWKIAQAEDAWEEGHGSYQGTLLHARLSVSPRRLATLKEASAFADSQAERINKGEVVAFAYGDAASAFPATTKDRDLVALHKKLAEETDLFGHRVLQRFVASKSASRRCTHCDSVISRKSRERLAREPYQATLDATADLFAKRDYVHSRTSCPACGHNLLLTDTDQKRKNVLEARFAEVVKKFAAAEASFKAKAKPYGYYVFGFVPY